MFANYFANTPSSYEVQCNILNCAVFITTTCNTETCQDCVGEGGGVLYM